MPKFEVFGYVTETTTRKVWYHVTAPTADDAQGIVEDGGGELYTEKVAGVDSDGNGIDVHSVQQII